MDARPAGAGGALLLRVVGCAAVFVDTACITILAPLLPAYVRTIGLSTASVGLLTAAYTVGVLVAAVPAGALVARAGPRTVVVSSLVLLAVASLGFGFAHDVALLVVARFAQGASGSLTWAGAFAWVTEGTPPGHRGRALGAVAAASAAGNVLGPVAGGTATAVGVRGVFCAVVALCAVIALGTALVPVAKQLSVPAQGFPVRALCGRRFRAGACLIVVAGVGAGLIAVLAPLRISRLGGGSASVASVFLAAALGQAVGLRFAGRVSDLRGRRLPIRLGLGLQALVLGGLFWWCPSVPVQGVAVVLAICGNGLLWVPAMALLSERATRAGVTQGHVFGFISLVWAAGCIVGSAGGGGLAGAAGDGVACGLVAFVLACTLLASLRLPRGATGIDPPRRVR
ncbi:MULTISPECIES: MFS transporter [unclassified Streptomyces]|uniref:MFS transporter n=1 Tax=unclassified Streptomyces TaxID=2593676 RepID=UPI0036EDBFF7